MRIFSNPLIIKQGLLLFWALWFSIAATTNIFDGLKVLGLLAHSWAFASGNYSFIVEITHVYNAPGWLTAFFFMLIIIWECAAAFLLWQAFRKFTGTNNKSLALIYNAFTVSMALWACFIIADEIFIAYKVENTHRQLLALQLLSLLALRLLPDENFEKNSS